MSCLNSYFRSLVVLLKMWHHRLFFPLVKESWINEAKCLTISRNWFSTDDLSFSHLGRTGICQCEWLIFSLKFRRICNSNYTERVPAIYTFTKTDIKYESMSFNSPRNSVTHMRHLITTGLVNHNDNIIEKSFLLYHVICSFVIYVFCVEVLLCW